MIDYSRSNHMTFDYAGRVFGEKNVGDSVNYNFSKCTRMPVSFADECRRTALLVHEEAEALGRPVYVLVSGGLDSVAMVKGFVAAELPFRTATYIFRNGQNEHEIEHVRDLVSAENLNHTYFEMDGVRWLRSSEAHEWFHRTNAENLATLPLMKLMEHVWFDLGGFPVFGGGDMDIIKENGVWCYSRFESFISRFWFSELYGLGNFTSFFQHTPEMILSILNEPEIVKAASGNDATANKVLKELKIVKYNVMHRTWPGLRRRLKFGGTEMIHHHIHATEIAWQRERKVQYGETWCTPYQEFREFLSP